LIALFVACSLALLVRLFLVGWFDWYSVVDCYLDLVVHPLDWLVGLIVRCSVERLTLARWRSFDSRCLVGFRWFVLCRWFLRLALFSWLAFVAIVVTVVRYLDSCWLLLNVIVRSRCCCFTVWILVADSVVQFAFVVVVGFVVERWFIRWFRQVTVDSLRCGLRLFVRC